MWQVLPVLMALLLLACEPPAQVDELELLATKLREAQFEILSRELLSGAAMNAQQQATLEVRSPDGHLATVIGLRYQSAAERQQQRAAIGQVVDWRLPHSVVDFGSSSLAVVLSEREEVREQVTLVLRN